MDIETQLIDELAENGTDKARELFLKWQEQRIKAKERLIEKLNAVNNNCDLADVSNLFSAQDKFLKTPLEAWMLVPCDLEGEPMFKPSEDRLKVFDMSLTPPDRDWETGC